MTTEIHMPSVIAMSDAMGALLRIRELKEGKSADIADEVIQLHKGFSLNDHWMKKDFINRAVNSHDDLVAYAEMEAALDSKDRDAAIKLLESHGFNGTCRPTEFVELKRRLALSKARGE